ncbi:MAG: hypothetical protein LLF94_07725 [Chlamydiales bacterium]|nr:hypothetical protein [Chlamydiales bacterium]
MYITNGESPFIGYYFGLGRRVSFEEAHATVFSYSTSEKIRHTLKIPVHKDMPIEDALLPARAIRWFLDNSFIPTVVGASVTFLPSVTQDNDRKNALLVTSGKLNKCLLKLKDIFATQKVLATTEQTDWLLALKNIRENSDIIKHCAMWLPILDNLEKDADSEKLHHKRHQRLQMLMEEFEESISLTLNLMVDFISNVRNGKHELALLCVQSAYSRNHCSPIFAKLYAECLEYLGRPEAADVYHEMSQNGSTQERKAYLEKAFLLDPAKNVVREELENLLTSDESKLNHLIYAYLKLIQNEKKVEKTNKIYAAIHLTNTTVRDPVVDFIRDANSPRGTNNARSFLYTEDELLAQFRITYKNRDWGLAVALGRHLYKNDKSFIRGFELAECLLAQAQLEEGIKLLLDLAKAEFARDPKSTNVKKCVDAIASKDPSCGNLPESRETLFLLSYATNGPKSTPVEQVLTTAALKVLQPDHTKIEPFKKFGKRIAFCIDHPKYVAGLISFHEQMLFTKDTCELYSSNGDIPKVFPLIVPDTEVPLALALIRKKTVQWCVLQGYTPHITNESVTLSAKVPTDTFDLIKLIETFKASIPAQSFAQTLHSLDTCITYLKENNFALAEIILLALYKARNETGKPMQVMYIYAEFLVLSKQKGAIDIFQALAEDEMSPLNTRLMYLEKALLLSFAFNDANTLKLYEFLYNCLRQDKTTLLRAPLVSLFAYLYSVEKKDAVEITERFYNRSCAIKSNPTPYFARLSLPANCKKQSLGLLLEHYANTPAIRVYYERLLALENGTPIAEYLEAQYKALAPDRTYTQVEYEEDEIDSPRTSIASSVTSLKGAFKSLSLSARNSSIDSDSPPPSPKETSLKSSLRGTLRKFSLRRKSDLDHSQSLIEEPAKKQTRNVRLIVEPTIEENIRHFFCPDSLPLAPLLLTDQLNACKKAMPQDDEWIHWQKCIPEYRVLDDDLEFEMHILAGRDLAIQSGDARLLHHFENLYANFLSLACRVEGVEHYLALAAKGRKNLQYLECALELALRLDSTDIEPIYQKIISYTRSQNSLFKVCLHAFFTLKEKNHPAADSYYLKACEYAPLHPFLHFAKLVYYTDSIERYRAFTAIKTYFTLPKLTNEEPSCFDNDLQTKALAILRNERALLFKSIGVQAIDWLIDTRKIHLIPEAIKAITSLSNTLTPGWSQYMVDSDRRFMLDRTSFLKREALVANNTQDSSYLNTIISSLFTLYNDTSKRKTAARISFELAQGATSAHVRFLDCETPEKTKALYLEAAIRAARANCTSLIEKHLAILKQLDREFTPQEAFHLSLLESKIS